MPVQFKRIQKAEPGVPGGGTKKWYASTVLNGESTLRDLIRSVEKISSMSGGDVLGVVYTLVDVIIDDLSDGRIVRLGELGDFRISISSEGHDIQEEVTATSIRGARINFRPGERLNEMLKTLSYERVE